MAPTTDDAKLLLRLASLGAQLPNKTAITMREDLPKNWSEFKQKYPPHTDEFKELMDSFMWWELAGSLYKRGLIDGELLYDWISPKFVWDRVGHLALGQREESGNPRIMENFELLVKDEAKYGAVPAEKREPAGVGV